MLMPLNSAMVGSVIVDAGVLSGGDYDVNIDKRYEWLIVDGVYKSFG